MNDSRTVYVQIISSVPNRCVFDFWRKTDKSDLLRGVVMHPAKDLFYNHIEEVTGLKNFSIVFVTG